MIGKMLFTGMLMVHLMDEPLKVSDIDTEELANSYGYQWNKENGTVQYGLNVSPNDFVKVPIDYEGK